MKVKFKKTHPDAVAPYRAHSDDAGFDLFAVDIKYKTDASLEGVRLYEYYEYDTGIVVEIPAGYVGLVFPRSSVSKTVLRLCNSVGVIDSGYRGNIKLRFAGGKGEHYRVGDKIGQIIIMPLLDVDFEETSTLSETDRGSGGFGSTGS